MYVPYGSAFSMSGPNNNNPNPSPSHHYSQLHNFCPTPLHIIARILGGFGVFGHPIEFGLLGLLLPLFI